MANKSLPIFPTLSEAKRVIWLCKQNQPNCRAGQAVVNTFQMSPELEDMLYECDDISICAILIHQFQNGIACRSYNPKEDA